MSKAEIDSYSYKAETLSAFEFGQVQGGGEHHYAVLCSRGLVMAKRAASCLIKPVAADKVMVVFAGNESYILSVLERKDDSLEIESEGNISLRSKHGDISLLAASDMHTVCAGTHYNTATSLQQITSQFQLTANQVDTTASNYQIHGQKAVVSIDDLSLLCRRVVQKSDQLYRWVTTMESSHIGNLMQSVKNTFCSRSKNSIITAKGDMKIDAERIHMG